MHAYLKSEEMKSISELTLSGILIKNAQDPIISKKGIIFVDGEGNEITETYRDLYQNSLKSLSILQQKGLKKNDYLILQVTHGLNFIRLFWGCILGGIIPIPLSVPLTLSTGTEAFQKLLKINEQLSFPFIAVEAQVLDSFKKEYSDNNLRYIHCEELMNSLESITEVAEVADIGQNDIAYIQYSSGSTGDPKGVLLSHKNLIWNVRQISKRTHIDCNDFTGSWMPLTHDMGLVGFHLTPTFNGINHLIMSPNVFIKKPRLFLQKIMEHNITQLGSPNFGLSWMMDKIDDEKIKGLDLSSIRLIYNGAEPISMEVVRRFYDKFKVIRLGQNVIYQVYGMAEACVAVAMPKVGACSESVIINRNNNWIGNSVEYVSNDNSNASEFAVVGRPMDGMEIKIIDDDKNLLEENQIGNIVIKGPNVFQGYFLQKGAAFTQEGFFHTGDLGFVDNGNLIITGRKKDIIFVHGQNYYAHDMENIMEENGSNQIIVCAYFNNSKAKDDIIVFIRFRKNIKGFTEIYRETQKTFFRLFGFFADFIIPIKTVPKTTSGKPQRYKLVEKFLKHEYDSILKEMNKYLLENMENMETVDSSLSLTDNIVYDKVLELAKKVFNINSLSVGDNLSSIGLDSIKLIQFLDEIQNEFHISIPIANIPSIKNIEEVCKIIINSISENEFSENIYPYSEGNPKRWNETFDLTEVQMAYLMGRQNAFEMGGISTHAYYEIETELNIICFNDALNKVIRRQPMLRAVVYDDGKQQVLENVPEYHIIIEDISNLGEGERSFRIVSERNRMSHFVFQNDKWPLFEFKAFKLTEKKNCIFLGFDLLTTDGSSMHILMKEIMKYYNTPDLIQPELEFSFSDYVRAYQEFKQSPIYHRDREYWKRKISDFPHAPQLPLIKQPETVGKPKFERIQKIYSKNRWVLLKKMAKVHGITPSTLLCTLYAEILCKWSNQPHMAINLTVFNRYPFHPDVKRIIGDFTSVLLIDIDLKPVADFWERTKKVQNTFFDSLEHRHYSGIDFIRDIVHYNGLNGKAAMPIVFTSMLFDNSEDGFLGVEETLGELKNGVSQTPQVYLDFQIMEKNNELLLSWDYCSDIFDRRMIEDMFSDYTCKLESIMDNLTYHITIPSDDKEFIARYNMTEEPIQWELLQNLINKQVKKTPDAIAIKFENETVTYQQMGYRSNQIARYLLDKGFSRGQYIGVLAERNIETIVNIVGILKAGCAYVPINPDHPEDRKKYILEHSNCKALLVPELYEQEKINHFDSSPVDNQNQLKDAAYVIYTSGSTGNPKGVVITHQAVSNTIIDINHKFNIGEKDKIIGLSSMCFDLSVYDIFGSLTSGAQLVLIPDLLDVNHIQKIIQEEGITVWNSVPAIMDMLIENMMDSSFEPSYWKMNKSFQSNMEFNGDLRVVMLSGDWIPIGLQGKICEKFPCADVISLGGATEASIWSIYFPIQTLKENWKNIPYGYPLANQKIYVLDFQMEECPVGVTGELYIGGVGVAEGYLNDVEKTEAAFIHHIKLGYIYKTGDYGILLQEGYIEFMGRKDQQVKIRGHRIELGEIENCLLKIPGVKNAVVTDRFDNQGKKYLCGYVVQESDIDVITLQGHLNMKLPDYMIPSIFIKVQDIPLTSNGKVDKKNLPEPDSTLNSSHELLQPRNELEHKLLCIWQHIFNTQNIGISDNFFELGGDSLKGAMLIAKTHKEMNVEMPIREIFQRPTIKEMAKYINNTNENTFAEIKPIGKKDYYVVSSAQRRMYILHRLEMSSTNYNTPGVLEVSGKFDRNRVEDVIDKLIQRHESFRTSFEMLEGEVVQRISDVSEAKLIFYDIREEKIDNEKRIKEIVQGFIKPFNLGSAPLLRVGLIQVEEERFILMVDTHHIITDGISKEIIVKEFTALYNRKKLPELRIQYKDFTAWQIEVFKSTQFRKQEEYWIKQLEGEIPVLNLPIDYTRPTVQSFEGDRLYFEFGKEITEGLKNLKEETGATLYMLLLSTFNIVLAKYSGQNDIVVGSPIAGRSQMGLENIVGIFMNTLVLRNKPEGDKTFREFLEEVKENVFGAYENQDYPFEELVDMVHINRDMSRNPLFDILLALQNMEVSTMEIKDLSITPYMVENKISKFDISIYAYEFENKISLEFEYCTKLYKKESIEKLALTYKKVLEVILANPDQCIQDIEAVNEVDKEKLLVDFNSTNVKYDKEKTIVEMFEEQVQDSPDAIALIFDEKEITYEELNARSNHLAAMLREKGVVPNSLVGIMIDRSFEMIIGILGVLKAGGAYLPIDPSYPAERVKFMLDDSGTKIVLTEKRYNERVSQRIETIDLMEEMLCNGSGKDLKKVNNATDLAYVIYTSGSTGKPKGVMIEHRALHNFIIGVDHEVNFNKGSRILAITTISFDIFALETILPLCKGLEIVIAGEREQVNPKLLGELIRKKQIEIMQLTPSRMKMLLTESRDSDYECVKTLLIGGEALPERLLEEISQKGKWEIYNMYGPTETTVWSSISELSGKKEVNIGKPISNTRIYILDKGNNICPIGVTGELCIGGDGLARGYLNRPELTAEKFVDSRYEYGKKIFKTGDLGRWLNDGNLECLGRIDNQVKVRGYRIELGEIENQLLKIDGIKESVVIARKDKQGEKYLCGYFVSDNQTTVKALRECLQQSLPEYMLPSHFMQLGKLPLTPNGKIDRNALPKPTGNVAIGTRYETARNEIEEKLVNIWKEVLGSEKIGINDNFFEVGGNSLGIVKLSSLISQELNQNIEPMMLFQYPNISSFAEFIMPQPEKDNSRKENLRERQFNVNKDQDKVKSADIAVIGMSGRFPQSNNLEKFWQNLREGRELISHFSKQELLESGVSKELLDNPRYVKAAARLEGIEYFDAEFFGYTRADAEIMDPQIRIFTECVWEALEDAGYNPEKYDSKIGIFAGASTNFDWQYMTFSQSMDSVAGLFNTMQLNDKQSIATLISYKLNLKGPSVYVNTACSTSLVSVHMACQSLISGECNMALAGGISVTQLKKEGYLYEQGMILSPDGHCRSFDEEANGTIFGNGAGVVLLKSLDEALRDRDNIYAVIKGSAVNNDGKNKVGYTAPSVEGQRKVIEDALYISGVKPESISYVETHGTATPLGDPIEIEGLKLAYYTGKKRCCAIGSVKTNMGHMDVASGVAGFIKTVLALKHREIPASLNYRKANPKINFEDSPFYVNTELKEWKEDGEYPLRAGVTSFGIGGTNSHVIVEEAPLIERKVKKLTWNILGISARTEKALINVEKNLSEYLKRNRDVNLEDVGFTLGVGRKEFKYRKAIVCQSVTSAIDIISNGDKENEEYGIFKEASKSVGFMFPGQGTQYIGMGKELYESEVRFREVMDSCFQISKHEIDYDLKNLLYAEGTDKRSIDETEVAQLVIFIFEYSLAQLLISWGIEPEWMIGHSIGEYVAATLAEVMSLEEAIKLVSVRGKLMQEMPRGVMLSVMLSEENAKKFVKDGVSIAAVNSSNMCVLSGKDEDIIHIEKELKDRVIGNIRLRTSHAYHSTLMSEAALKYREYLKKIKFQSPKKKYISNVTGQWIKDEEATDPEYWVKHMLGTVKFEAGIREILKNKSAVMIEVGPGRGLCTLAKENEMYIGEQPVVNLIRHMKEDKSDLAYLAEKLSELWAGGMSIDWEKYYHDTGARRISLPTYPFERKRYWLYADKFGTVNPLIPYNGKLELRENTIALREVSAVIEESGYERSELSTNFQKAETLTEKKLVELEEEIFGIKGIGITDNFYELGGDSLKAVMLIAKIHKEMNVEFLLREVLERPTIKEIAEYVMKEEKKIYSGINPVPIKEYYEVTSAQKRLYILNKMEERSTNYNVPDAVKIEGKLDKNRVQFVIRKLIERHEAFRTSFEMVEGEIVQKIADKAEIDIIFHDIREETNNKENRIEKIIQGFVNPFDLSKMPLLRVGLIQTEEEGHILIFDLHHIISDGTSMQIIIKDFIKIYNGEKLLKLKLQYKDFTAWKNGICRSKKVKKQEKYWVNQFEKEIPVLNLPTDYPRLRVQSFEGDQIYFELEKHTKEGLEGLIRETGVTLNMVLLSAFNILLSKYSGQEDIVIGSPIAGRPHIDLENIVGMFVNTLALRNRVDGNKTFKDFLEEVKINSLKSYENQDYPFDELIEKIVVNRDRSRNPLFDVMFVQQNREFGMEEITGLKIKPYRFKKNETMFDISLLAYEEDNEIKLVMEFCTKLYKKEKINRMANDFVKIVKIIVDKPNILIRDIDLQISIKLLEKVAMDVSFDI